MKNLKQMTNKKFVSMDATPCIHGHLGMRYASTRQCCECLREREQTEERKEYRKLYEQTDAAKKRQAEYQGGEKGKARTKRYHQTDKGREALARAKAKYRAKMKRIEPKTGLRTLLGA